MFCELLLDCDEFQSGDPVLVTLITKDQYGRIAHSAAGLAVDITVTSINDNDENDVMTATAAGNQGLLTSATFSKFSSEIIVLGGFGFEGYYCVYTDYEALAFVLTTPFRCSKYLKPGSLWYSLASNCVLFFKTWCFG